MMIRFLLILSAVFLLPGSALAQLAAPNAAGVAMGHLHLNTMNIAAQEKFWVEAMGGTPIKLGPMDGVKFPGVVVLFHKGQPTAGTKGSVVNHIGFKVRDLKATVARMKAAGANFVTRTEVSGGRAKGDYWYNPPQKALQAFVMGPDDVKIELTEDPTMTVPIENHHIHFFTTDVPGMKAWYAKTFDAIPGKRGQFEADDLPGVNLSFSPSSTPTAPTKGRSLDHIGFEVKNLDAFCKKLEASGVKFDVPYRKVPKLGLSIAFLTDPWGTYIELTEGLDRL
jgi:catechol 2,3-dioxygenase-like lactoylglutathione lyase family enzyme